MPNVCNTHLPTWLVGSTKQFLKSSSVPSRNSCVTFSMSSKHLNPAVQSKPCGTFLMVFIGLKFLVRGSGLTFIVSSRKANNLSWWKGLLSPFASPKDQRIPKDGVHNTNPQFILPQIKASCLGYSFKDSVKPTTPAWTCCKTHAAGSRPPVYVSKSYSPGRKHWPRMKISWKVVQNQQTCLCAG